MNKKENQISIRSSAAEYLTYIASTGDNPENIEIRYEDENIWLTQKLLAVLYDVDVRTINEHIKKIFSDSELDETSTIRKFRIVQTEGNRKVSREVKHYNLQMIITIGFKVNSERAVQFRKWVNQIAKEYTIKGWVMDEERLKECTYLSDKYFEEQLERIREIRASERKFYQKVTDLYATAVDYDKDAASTRRFYASVQNRMHYAVHGHTAAESTPVNSAFRKREAPKLLILRGFQALSGTLAYQNVLLCGKFGTLKVAGPTRSVLIVNQYFRLFTLLPDRKNDSLDTVRTFFHNTPCHFIKWFFPFNFYVCLFLGSGICYNVFVFQPEYRP